MRKDLMDECFYGECLPLLTTTTSFDTCDRLWDVNLNDNLCEMYGEMLSNHVDVEDDIWACSCMLLNSFGVMFCEACGVFFCIHCMAYVAAIRFCMAQNGILTMRCIKHCGCFTYTSHIVSYSSHDTMLTVFDTSFTVETREYCMSPSTRASQFH